MRYSYKTTKRKPYIVKGVEVPEAIGEGETKDEAFASFLTSFIVHIGKCLKEGVKIAPEFKGKERSNTFGLPLNMTLKIKLNNTMLNSGVTRTELAHLLALTYEEVPNENWTLEALKKLKPKGSPKYKNVQRLFDINHDSTVREVEQAYRVLGYNVNVSPVKKPD